MNIEELVLAKRLLDPYAERFRVVSEPDGTALPRESVLRLYVRFYDGVTASFTDLNTVRDYAAKLSDAKGGAR